MKVVIKENALELHSKSIPASMGHTRDTMSWRSSIAKMLDKSEDRTFEVCASHLFDKSFNVVNPHSQYVIQIPDYMVEAVIDDERIGKSKCGYCGKVAETSQGYCEKGCKLEYFKPLLKD